MTLLTEGIEKAMNRFNGKARKQDPEKNGKHGSAEKAPETGHKEDAGEAQEKQENHDGDI